MTLDLPKVGPLTDLHRALRLLCRFRDASVIDVDELSGLLETTPDAVRALLNVLTSEGFIEPIGPAGLYRPGPVLGDLGFSVRGSSRTVDLARPILVALAQRSEETSQLGLLDGTSVRIADAVECPRSSESAGTSARSSRSLGASGQRCSPAPRTIDNLKAGLGSCAR